MNKSTLYQPKIMGIINVTPDSFSDGGQFAATNTAIAHGLRLAKEGADILDVGGESTRPGAVPVSVDEELARVIPVIEGLRAASDIPISIDTRHSRVMKAAVVAGATLINDVSALNTDSDALSVAASLKVPVCLMHMQGEPSSMQQQPHYEDVVREVYDFLAARVKACEAVGIAKEKIYLDVGIGFGKTLEHNLTLLKNLHRFRELGTKLLVGTSRKSFIEKIMGEPTAATDRLPGSLASLVPALAAKVDIVRVHDVAATRQFIATYLAVRGMTD